MNQLRYTIFAASAVFGSVAFSQTPYTVTKTVDTGSHTCTRQGQDVKVYDVAEAPPDRYFVESTVRFGETSKFGAGNCVFTNDGGASVDKKTVTLKLANGQTVRADVPIRYHLRAYADCTNDLRKIATQIGTECRFSGETDRYE